MTGLDGSPPRVLVDQMCGRLVPYLRLCGWDTVYTNDQGLERDAVIRRLAEWEGRLVLSRDRELVRSAKAGILIETTDVESQLGELVAAGASLSPADPPTRCGRCNGPLVDEPPNVTRPAYAPSDDTVPCWRCRHCGQYFWKGSHWDRMRDTVRHVAPP